MVLGLPTAEEAEAGPLSLPTAGFSSDITSTGNENTIALASIDSTTLPLLTSTNLPIPASTNLPIPASTNLPIPASTSLPILPIPTSTNLSIPASSKITFIPTSTASSSSTAQELNPTGIIIGATLGSISFIVIVLFILRWRKRKRRRKSSQKIDAVPFNIKHNVRITRNEKGMAGNTRIPGHGRQQASERSRSRALSESDSTLTARQRNIRSEADDLRRQLRTIRRAQAAMVTSNDINDLKNTLAVIMAHIQRLDRQFESDWARGLTDEAPPDYITVARG
ncbi:hypothetical protein VKT23_014351 [Stygiomarasmius scandens]|uniref:Uncharacterized protein n=1 Tax=Marasmiellus scandens TaxID=2682957 RepID=A0ABR1J2V0_9AGAR